MLTMNFDSGGLDILQEIIVVDMTSLKERPIYLAMMALPIAVGSIMGPIIGALLCQFATWRWLGWYENKPKTCSSMIYNLTWNL
jgi:MFS family permease